MVMTTSVDGPPTRMRWVLIFGRQAWLWVALVMLGLLPIIGGATGLISDYGFLQLSLMIVYSIAVLGLSLLTGFNGSRSAMARSSLSALTQRRSSSITGLGPIGPPCRWRPVY